jgi:hypothetical protein
LACGSGAGRAVACRGGGGLAALSLSRGAPVSGQLGHPSSLLAQGLLRWEELVRWCRSVDRSPAARALEARSGLPGPSLTWACGPDLGMTWAASASAGRSRGALPGRRLVHRSSKGTRKEGRQRAWAAGVMLEVVAAACVAFVKCWPLVGSVLNW